jgi:hypothetical protein
MMMIAGSRLKHSDFPPFFPVILPNSKHLWLELFSLKRCDPLLTGVNGVHNYMN